MQLFPRGPLASAATKPSHYEAAKPLRSITGYIWVTATPMTINFQDFSKQRANLREAHWFVGNGSAVLAKKKHASRNVGSLPSGSSSIDAKVPCKIFETESKPRTMKAASVSTV